MPTLISWPLCWPLGCGLAGKAVHAVHRRRLPLSIALLVPPLPLFLTEACAAVTERNSTPDGFSRCRAGLQAASMPAAIIVAHLLPVILSQP